MAFKVDLRPDQTGGPSLVSFWGHRKEAAPVRVVRCTCVYVVLRGAPTSMFADNVPLAVRRPTRSPHGRSREGVGAR